MSSFKFDGIISFLYFSVKHIIIAEVTKPNQVRLLPQTTILISPLVRSMTIWYNVSDFSVRRGHRDAGKGLRVSGRVLTLPLSLFAMNPNQATLSVFVDESGNFRFPDSECRFYILTLLFHDQSLDISTEIQRLEKSDEEIGLQGHCFHAGPLIRREKNYSMLSRHLRGRILSRMMAFARRVDFRYHCLTVDKKFIDSKEQIVSSLKSSLLKFIQGDADVLKSANRVKIYYDCGQAPVTHMLHDVFEDGIGGLVEFATGVKPSRYRLFLLADLICTLHLIESKLNCGIRFSRSEQQFFGGPKKFRHNILRSIKTKEI